MVSQIGSVGFFWLWWNARVARPWFWVVQRSSPILSPVWFRWPLACCHLFRGWACFGSPGPRLLSVFELEFLRRCTGWLPCLAWCYLFSTLKPSLWELHDCSVMGGCCCRSAVACVSLQNKRILKEKSGSVRFYGSSSLHVWGTQRYQEVYIHSVLGFGGGWVPILFMPQVRIARLVPEYDLKMDFKEMILQSLLGH